MKNYLILDIGGTKTTAVVFDENDMPLTPFIKNKSKTYEGEEAVLKNTIACGYEALKAAGITSSSLSGVGVAAPGPLDYRTGRIIDVPMMGWKDFPLGDLLRKEFGVPVLVENDGNLGALAEANVGAAKGEQTVLYQTISTGCGGGIAINGDIFHGKHGFAGEFGHVSINFEGISCGCGNNGCFETYASGTALKARMKRDMRKGIRSAVFDAVGQDPGKLNGGVLAEAAAAGDRYALEMLEEEGVYIGTGLANLVNLFDPDAIVLAGGVMKAQEFFWDSMMDTVHRKACFHVEDDVIRLSKLNDEAVAWGAYVMIRRAMEKS